MRTALRFIAALALLVTVSLPADAKVIDGISYSLNATDKKAQVKGFASGKETATLVIPDKVTAGGVTYKVTSIANEAFRGQEKLKTVQIGNYVETIGTRAFSGTDVKTLTLGDRVKIIGQYAFYNTAVTQVTFPASLQILRSSAFYSCSMLKDVQFDGTKLTEIGDYAFYNCKALVGVSMPSSVTTLGVSAFEDCEALTNLTLSEKLTVIPEAAFSRCPLSAQTLTFPASVTTIGKSAFFMCAAPQIYIPGTVKVIGEWAFEDAQAQSVVLNYGITTIGANAFTQMYNLKAVTIPNSVTAIGERAFSSCGLQRVDLSSGVKVIPEYAFYDCQLREVNIPYGVQTIGESAFRDNRHLWKVTIPSSVKTIAKDAFYLNSITELVMAEGVEVIGDGAFSWIEAPHLVIPASVKSIGSTAFAPQRFKTVTAVSPTPCSLVDDGFSSDAYMYSTLIVPDGAVEAYREAPGWRKFTYIHSVSDEGSIEDVMADTEIVTTRFFGIDGVEHTVAPAGQPYIRVDVTAGGRRIVSKRSN